MSETRNKERMNSIFQESNLQGLTEPEPGVNSRGDFTLTWISDSIKVQLVFIAAIYIRVKTPNRVTNSFSLNRLTDAGIVSTVERHLSGSAASK